MISSLAHWVQNNFLYAIVLGVVIVIAGGFVAFQLDNKFGYILLAVGAFFIVWSMRAFGLI